MALIVTRTEFRSRTAEYFRRVEVEGKELVIMDGHRPVARILPWRQTEDDTGTSLLGSVVGYEEPFEPVGVEDWDVLK